MTRLRSAVAKVMFSIVAATLVVNDPPVSVYISCGSSKRDCKVIAERFTELALIASERLSIMIPVSTLKEWKETSRGAVVSAV